MGRQLEVERRQIVDGAAGFEKYGNGECEQKWGQTDDWCGGVYKV